MGDGFCGSIIPRLPLINSAEVILCDQEIRNNEKVRDVIKVLCDAIPKWTDVVSYRLPHGVSGIFS
jgi:hypothetical protein